MDKELKLEDYIAHLMEVLKEHGNVPVFTSDDSLISKAAYYPNVQKVYHCKSYDMLSSSLVEEKDEELFDVDLDKPIIKALLI